MKRRNLDMSGVVREPKRQHQTDTNLKALIQGKFELRFLVSGRSAGPLIGRGGENFLMLRNKYNVNVKILGKADERVFVLSGTVDQLIGCFNEVLDVLTNYQEYTNKLDQMEIRMLIHESLAEQIHGVDGEILKELSEKISAQLKIHSTNLPKSTDRILEVTAPKEVFTNTFRALINYVKDIPIKGEVQQYDPNNYDFQAAPAYGGFSKSDLARRQNHQNNEFSKGVHKTIQTRMNSFKPAIDNPSFGQASPQTRTIYPISKYLVYEKLQKQLWNQIVLKAKIAQKCLLLDKVNHQKTIFQLGHAQTTAQNYPYEFLQNKNASNQQHGAKISFTLSIPNKVAGAVIGRMGKNINRIRRDTGAEVLLGPSTQDSEIRMVNITGTAPQIRAAQFKLEKSIKSTDFGYKNVYQFY